MCRVEQAEVVASQGALPIETSVLASRTARPYPGENATNCLWSTRYLTVLVNQMYAERDAY